jgi:very-short-patch-repair endonuclease
LPKPPQRPVSENDDDPVSIDRSVLGHAFGQFRIDLAFPAAKVAVEVDGWAWHVDAERFRADQRKGNMLTRAGWQLLRFTWHSLDGSPAEVVAEIAESLAPAA